MSDTLKQRYGRSALVTGASSGIGRAFARALATEGFNLILVARRESALQALAEELGAKYRVEVAVRAVDLSRPDATAALLESLGEQPVDLLVSNAGFGFKGLFEQTPLAEQVAMVNTNCLASVALCHHCLPAMKARRRGGVILTGSIEGETAFPWSSTYAATKAFVHSLGIGLWEECRGTGVDVLVLAPGSTDTEAPRKQGFSNEQLSGFMPPERVVKEALAQLGKTPLWIPGWQNRLLIGLMRNLPRRWAAGMAAKGLKAALAKSHSRQGASL